MSKQIPLSRGLFAIVDDEDYEYLNQWKWSALKTDKTFYAVRRNGNKTVLMHRFILLDCALIDHKDLNGLNNTRENLRPATRSQNGHNASLRRNNTSGHRGISWDTQTNSWSVCIMVNRKNIRIGRFKNIADAIKAYDDADAKYYRDFASP